MPSNTRCFEIRFEKAAQQLQECLYAISDSSRNSSTTCYELHLIGVQISRIILDLLVEILKLPLHKQPDAKHLKWDLVRISGTRFVGPGQPWHDPDERRSVFPDVSSVRILGDALSHRISHLDLAGSPEILACLFSMPKLEIEKLTIVRCTLSALECERLGGMVQRNVQLKYLGLSLAHLGEPRILAESVGNATYLQELSITETDTSDHQTVSDTVVRPGGDDIVVRLLQNSQSRLRKLYLQSLDLKGFQLTAILELLPMSKLEVLFLNGNNIQLEGILSLAMQLPRIKSLKVLNLGDNPWQDDHEKAEACWAALLCGLLANFSVESLGERDSCPTTKLVRFFCILNRAGRYLLEAPDVVPLGLWPFVLELAGKDTYEDCATIDQETKVAEYRAESIYFFLQNNPLLTSIYLSKNRRKPMNS